MCQSHPGFIGLSFAKDQDHIFIICPRVLVLALVPALVSVLETPHAVRRFLTSKAIYFLALDPSLWSLPRSPPS